MKVVEMPERSQDDTFTVTVGYKDGTSATWTGAEGVDFDSFDGAYGIIDGSGDLIVVMHSAIQSIQMTKDKHGTND
jgi:hypothetical protein